MTVEDTYREGDAVEARHRGGKNYYPGRINKVNNGGGTYAVDYDDGDKEDFSVREIAGSLVNVESEDEDGGKGEMAQSALPRAHGSSCRQECGLRAF